MRLPERPPLFALIMVIIIGVIGAWLAALGGYLAILGGSIYYVVAGITLLVAAAMLYRRNATALTIYAALLVLTIVWALWEVGLDFWQLAPRGDLLVPIGVLLILPWLTRTLRTS